MKPLSPWVLFSKNAGCVCSQQCLSSLPDQVFSSASQVTLNSLEIQRHVLHSESKHFAFGCWSPHTQQNAGPQQPPSLLAGDVLPYATGPTMPGKLSKEGRQLWSGIGYGLPRAGNSKLQGSSEMLPPPAKLLKLESDLCFEHNVVLTEALPESNFYPLDSPDCIAVKDSRLFKILEIMMCSLKLPHILSNEKVKIKSCEMLSYASRDQLIKETEKHTGKQTVKSSASDASLLPVPIKLPDLYTEPRYMRFLNPQASIPPWEIGWSCTIIMYCVLLPILIWNKKNKKIDSYFSLSIISMLICGLFQNNNCTI